MTTPGSPALDVPAYLGRLRAEGGALAASAAGLDLGLPVPACPGWTLRDLLRHTGYVHRWATRYVAQRLTEAVPRLDEAGVLAADIPDAGLLDWFRAGHAALVSALEAAGPGLACWTFLPGAASPLGFWARRQAHETTVHRVDVQQTAAAAGPGRAADPVPDAFAADGIDELIMGFARRNAPRGPLSDPPRRLFVECGGPGGPPPGDPRPPLPAGAGAGPYRWVARMGPDRAGVDRGWDGPPGPADCTVTGPAPEVYLLLWNRRGPEGLAVTGDPGVLAHWRAGTRVTWR